MEHAVSELPRPEYPRPQFVRRDWLNLNGDWEFAFDDADEGLSAGWNEGRTLPQRIVVPFAIRRSFRASTTRAFMKSCGMRAILKFRKSGTSRIFCCTSAPVDYRCTVWGNGQEVDTTRADTCRSQFDIAPNLREGRNRIMLRWKTGRTRIKPARQAGGERRSQGIDYYCTKAIWQTVWLNRHRRCASRLNITPHLEDETLDCASFSMPPSIGWHLQAKCGWRRSCSARRRRKKTQPAPGARLTLHIPDAKPWSHTVAAALCIRFAAFARRSSTG
jgi:hypothetical protein